jgi:hypothetical protein
MQAFLKNKLHFAEHFMFARSYRFILGLFFDSRGSRPTDPCNVGATLAYGSLDLVSTKNAIQLTQRSHAEQQLVPEKAVGAGQPRNWL